MSKTKALQAKMTGYAAHDGGLLRYIEAAERQAHADGFHVTAHALNRAKNALGWEMAGDVEQASRASRDERPKR